MAEDESIFDDDDGNVPVDEQRAIAKAYAARFGPPRTLIGFAAMRDALMYEPTQAPPRPVFRAPSAAELQERIKEERARRDGVSAALGHRVVERVASRLRYAERVPPQQIEGWLPPTRAKRPSSWKGPHHGTRFTDPTALEKAVRETCLAGYEATWGYAPTKRMIDDVFGKIARSKVASEIEADARNRYRRLRAAIDEALSFARQHNMQTYGPATVALESLWEVLPTLPELETLPYYAKVTVPRRRLVDSWQWIARTTIGRKLERKELAELSLLLGVGPGCTYKRLFKEIATRRGATVAEAVDYEANRLDRLKTPT